MSTIKPKKTQSTHAGERAGYAPIKINPKADIARQRLADPAFSSAFDELADEFETLAALLQARREANLSQRELAMRMGVKQPSIARLEGSLGHKGQSPTFATLRRYAQACGKKLVIRMEAA